MTKRKLTGDYYIQKKWYGFKIKVLVIKQHITDDEDQHESEPQYIWEKATASDIVKLKLNFI